MAIEPIIDELVLREEEGLFSRGIDGQLVRMDKVTAEDFDKLVTITIDGQEITVPKAVPQRDSQGTILRDSDGQPKPRATTIYDAASKVFVKKLDDRNPIPILCHQEHMNPVAVCRVCAVQISRKDKGRPERKLLPACQHRVEEGMIVQTIASQENLTARRQIHSSVQMLVEMLAADHLKDGWEKQFPENELGTLVRRLDELAIKARDLEQQAKDKPLTAAEAEAKWPLVNASRFSNRTFDRGTDESRLISVDHNQCILCDRCSRGCDEIKQNMVIGRTGKGYNTTIGFDLDDPMGKSSCVSCGECMISCPTGALMFRQEVVESKDVRSGHAITVEELRKIPLFAKIPWKFLAWNAHSVERRTFNEPRVLCREGEPGNTAFVLLKGSFDISIGGRKDKNTEVLGPFKAFVRGMTSRMWPSQTGQAEAHAASVATDGGSLKHKDGKWSTQIVVSEGKTEILGEMSCLNHYPRSATVTANPGGEVLEINRNVLYMLQRNEQSRKILDDAYRSRSLDGELRNMTIFGKLSDEERKQCAAILKDHSELVRADRGQVILRQGEVAQDFFKVRLGFVKITQIVDGQERVLTYLGPGSIFGEIGLLSAILFKEDGPFRKDAGGQYRVELAPAERNRIEQLSDQLKILGIDPATRTATCTALDDVELIRVRKQDFERLVTDFPGVRNAVLEVAAERLAQDAKVQERLKEGLGSFLTNGLYSAQKLLVLDLESCTRCDECTRACSDTHEGVTRLIREGLRFENFLVASSCRSCLDPYCLVGCPVDAIHRKPRKRKDGDKEDHGAALEIVIESHCIGCGQCSKNCPYGNISMHYDTQASKRQATTCDLCRDVKGVGVNDDPSCVYACPHNAAFRMTGDELREKVNERRGTLSMPVQTN